MKFRHLFPIVAAVPAAHAWTPSTEPPITQLEAFVCSEKDFEITAWATSPMFHNPANMDIDHLGRIWITEGVNYRHVSNRRPEGDRVVMLEDTDGDGKADKSTVFYQDPELTTPLGIAVFDNVVIVSQPPNLLKLTDVDRNGKLELDKGDKREVILTGFNGYNHDHSLHSLTGGPDGKWYFNQGNMCGQFTDASGKTFRIGSPYEDRRFGKEAVDSRKIAGEKSDDGFVYVGGFTVRMNPDATHAEIIGHNYRNSYEQTINTLGDLYQNDNDDPPACRVTHILERGNAGFASRDGKRSWKADQRPGQDTPTAEWRQWDPDTMPAGDVYGGGSPTGIAFYENGAMGDAFNGTLLSCEPGKNVVFSYRPEIKGAGRTLDRKDFLTTNTSGVFAGSDFVGGNIKDLDKKKKEDIQHLLFRPSDITVGPDGALYVSDWTDPRVGGHGTQDEGAGGIIYRLAPKGFKSVVPKIDLNTIDGAVAALKSPAVNTRWLGFQKLKSEGAKAYDAVVAVLDDKNPFIANRAIWLLPYLGEKGVAKLDTFVASKDEAQRLIAFRAVRRTDGKVDALPYAKKLAKDPSSAIRAEAAQEMRYRSFDEAKEVLVEVARAYDGEDRAYLFSIGAGAGQNTAQLWSALSEALKPGEPSKWSDTFARLTWRLMPEAAVPALKARALDGSLSEEQRKMAVDTIAFIKAAPSVAAMLDLASNDSPVKDQAKWWLTNRSEGEWASMGVKEEMQKRGLIEKPVEIVEVTVPAKPSSTKFTAADVLALKGDAAKGKLAAARCVMCHKVDGQGVEHGPDLKGFGSRQPAEVVARAIVDPSAEIALGFEGVAIRTKGNKWIDGLIVADGDPVTIRSTGGIVQKVAKKDIAERKQMDRSLMLNADQLGLSAQDVADIVEWMKAYK
ncbi:MAG: c-type cytochrome [Akkermansiaceae bacterium]|nr:c-type cytochrome [Akkermansiaceae bacterium]